MWGKEGRGGRENWSLTSCTHRSAPGGKNPFSRPAAARWPSCPHIETRTEYHPCGALVHSLLSTYKAFQGSSNIVTLKRFNCFQGKEQPNRATSRATAGGVLFVCLAGLLFGLVFFYYLLTIKSCRTTFISLTINLLVQIMNQ